MNLDTYAKRLNWAMSNAAISQSELARAIGVKPQAIQYLCQKGTKSTHTTKIAKALGVSADWLDTGKGSPEPKPSEKSEIVLGQFDVWDDDTPLHEDDVELPFFREVELAAGSGRTEVQENHGLKLRFSKRTLKRQGIQIEYAACVTVKGNSMEPALPDGCTIGIDTSKKHITNGKMYAIDHDGELRVKMLYKMPGGLIRLRSHNEKEWPDETVPAHDIKILGQVFWYSVLL